MGFVTVDRMTPENRSSRTDLDWSAYCWAQAGRIHEQMKTDRNLLYKIEGTDSYTNEPALSASNVPAGYGFVLYFYGEKVTVTKDGQHLDVYGDGWYNGREGQG